MEHISIEASASGDNAYYIDYCEVVQHRPSYAACLCKLKNANDACVSASGTRTCSAAKLREREEDAGHAIFFVSRKEIRAKFDDGVGSISIPTPVIAKKPKETAKAMPSYADVINKMMEESHAHQ